MKSISFGQYYPVDSFLHRMDSRAKMTALFFYFITLFMAKGVLLYSLVTLLGVAMVFCSRVPLKIYWRGSRLILFFVIFAALFNVFFTPGEVLWSFGILELTKEGLLSAFTMSLRLLLLILSAFVLTFTTTPMAVTDGLETMGRPLERFHVPVHDIAMIMSIALRFIPTIMTEAETIKKAQQSRGVDFSLRNFKNFAENMVALVVPLFVSAFHRSEELAYAMDARGYGGGIQRTMFRRLVLKPSDIFIVIGSILCLFFTVVYRWFL